MYICDTLPLGTLYLPHKYHTTALNEVLAFTGVISHLGLIVIVMKSLTRIFVVGVAMFTMSVFAPQSAEAQFLKKLSQGLEKVNNTLERVNDTVDDAKKGDIGGLINLRNNKQQQNISNNSVNDAQSTPVQSTPTPSVPEEVVEEEVVPDESIQCASRSFYYSAWNNRNSDIYACWNIRRR